MGYADMRKGKKQGGILTNAINSYLLTKIEENDRRNDIYSPSLISGGCLIALILDKIGFDKSRKVIDPQRKRIFENGSLAHERLQGYAKHSGISVFQEVALKHPTCNMYGTCDDVLFLPRNDEVIIGDYKTIKAEKFEKDLKVGALPSNVGQITMYVGMMELRRKHLRATYKTEAELITDTPARIKYYREHYFDHIKDGAKYTRQQKLAHLIGLALDVDLFMYHVKKPLERFILLYENKNTQGFKEFEYKFDQDKFEGFVTMCEDATKWLDEHRHVNADTVEYLHRKNEILPERKEQFKISSEPCVWCPYKEFCYESIKCEGDGVDGEVKGTKKTGHRKANPLKRKRK